MAKPQQTTSLGNFNYGSLQSLMVFFSVPASVVRPLLAGTGLEPGIFDGNALVNLNFERYAGFGSNYSSFVDEVEFNAVVFPKYKAGQEPALTVAQYLTGEDQSKTYGNYRINVPCDSAVAVQAGSQKYGEVKFVASFDFTVPDVNDPLVSSWWIRCYATPTAPKSQLPYIFDLKVNTNATGVPAPGIVAFSPVPAYANLVVKKKKHMVTSARVIFGVFRSWFNIGPDDADRAAPGRRRATGRRQRQARDAEAAGGGVQGQPAGGGRAALRVAAGGRVGPHAARPAPSSRSAMKASAKRTLFLAFSAELTGYTETDLEGTGNVDSFLNVLEQQTGAKAMTLFYDAAAAVLQHGSAAARAEAMRIDVLPSPTVWPMCASLIMLWYQGFWPALAASWYTRYWQPETEGLVGDPEDRAVGAGLHRAARLSRGRRASARRQPDGTWQLVDRSGLR